MTATEDDDWQSPELMAAHYGPDGPVSAVRRWLRAVLQARDYATAWELTDATLRLARAQAWVFNNQEASDVAGEDREQLATDLALGPGVHPLWDAFAETELWQMNDAWAGYDVDALAAGSRPRPYDAEHEVVLMTPVGANPEVIQGPTVLNDVLPFIVHHTPSGWLVAAITASRLPEPGWPPVL